MRLYSVSIRVHFLKHVVQYADKYYKIEEIKIEKKIKKAN